jgi:hypothetical protein
MNTHVKVAYENLVIIKAVSDNKSRNLGVHNPMQHSRPVTDDRTKVGIEMNGHHCLIYHFSVLARSLQQT